MSQVDFKKFVQGWESRLNLGRAVLRGVALPEEVHSSEDCVSRSALIAERVKQPGGIPTNLHVARVVLTFRTVNEQLGFINQFDNSVTKLTAPLTVGSIFAQPRTRLDEVPNEDYSLVCLSSALAAGENCQDSLEAVAKSINQFLSELGVGPSDGLTSFQLYAETLGVKPLALPGIRGISTVAFQLKQLRWAILGADLLSLLQALCDPLHTLTVDQIKAGCRLASIWRVNLLVAKLVLLRAFGGYAAEREFYLENRAFFSSVSRGVLRIADAIFAVKDSEKSANHLVFVKNLSQGDLTTQLLSLSANIALATHRHALPILKQQILTLYNLDSSAPFFLNWLKIHTTFPLPASEADLSSIFLKSIMSSTVVGRRFFTVALARGKGQLVADLSSYVTRLRTGRDMQADPSIRPLTRPRTKGAYDFVRGMRTLPINVRSKLMEEVLDKGMMERLAFAFPTSITLPDAGLSRSDNQASLLRIELANLARRENVLSDRRAFRIIDEETQYLRMLQFHTFFKAGRVKIDWDYLTFIIGNSIETRLDLLLSKESETTIHTLVYKNVVDLIAQEISDTLLFDSEASLDQALSNNLRHGVIVPRFLRAINDALSATSDGANPLADFGEAAQSRFGRNAKHILSLRETIVALVNEFKDYWLTVNRSGSFSAQTKAMVSTRLLGVSARQSALDAWSLSEEIVEEFRKNVEEIIQQMLAAFRDDIQPKMHDAIMLAHRECNRIPSNRTTSFLDSLETNIRAANQDVVGWLGVSKFEMTVDDFDIMELIRFESSSFILSDFHKLNVKYFSYEKTGSKLLRQNEAHRFKGAYFEAIQEIVHNLISNAFKHSSLKVNTEVIFSVIVDDGDLIFRCENNFAEAHFDRVISERENGLRIIKQERPDQVQDDVLSGFHKIKNVCSRVFGQDVVINIPPISPKLKRFMIEITVEDVARHALA